MKRWLISLCCLFCFHPVYAFDLEEKMYLAEHYISLTSTFDISTDDRKLGTVYRRLLSLTASYDFYDFKNQPIASAESHFFSFGAHLDVYDENKALLGTVEEQLLNWFPSFDIYSPDGMRLSRAKMNFWGTTFTLYDGNSDRVLAEMSRPFFRFRNYWTIQIKNMSRVKERNIDSRLLLTVLAAQGDLEYQRERVRDLLDNLNKKDDNKYNRHLTTANETQANVQALHNKFSDFLKKEAELSDIALPDDKQLDALATQLDQDFHQQNAGITMNQAEEAEQFISFCVNVAESSYTSPEIQKAIMHLLNKKLSGQAAQ
ncbi:MAG: hypothetical protein NTU48_01260 [Legionellales bacterium]|nr:hypothetical protein [Legionellales bacterium]